MPSICKALAVSKGGSEHVSSLPMLMQWRRATVLNRQGRHGGAAGSSRGAAPRHCAGRLGAGAPTPLLNTWAGPGPRCPIRTPARHSPQSRGWRCPLAPPLSAIGRHRPSSVVIGRHRSVIGRDSPVFPQISQIFPRFSQIFGVWLHFLENL